MDYYGVNFFDIDFNFKKSDKNLEHERVKEEYENSIYFQNIPSEDSKYIPSENLKDENNPSFFSMEKIDTKSNGFGCQNLGCNNNEVRYGLIYLPFCNENKNCMKKNIEYLLLENAKYKGFVNNVNNVNNVNVNNDETFYNLCPMEIDDKESKRKSKKFNETSVKKF